MSANCNLNQNPTKETDFYHQKEMGPVRSTDSNARKYEVSDVDEIR